MPVSWGLTTTTCATCGAPIRAISAALPMTSNTTRSVGARLDANNSNAAGVVSIRPAERTSPAATIATSHKSRCTSTPIALNVLEADDPAFEAAAVRWIARFASECGAVTLSEVHAALEALDALPASDAQVTLTGLLKRHGLR